MLRVAEETPFVEEEAWQEPAQSLERTASPSPPGFAVEIVDDNIINRRIIDALTRIQSLLGINEIAIAGGVSANSYLRKRLIELQEIQKKNVFIPKFEYCTDNAAMIAITGYYQFLEKDFSDQSVTPTSRLKL